VAGQLAADIPCSVGSSGGGMGVVAAGQPPRRHPPRLPEDRAPALLATVRPRDLPGRTGRQLAVDLVGELEASSNDTGCPEPGTGASTTSSTWPGSCRSATTPRPDLLPAQARRRQHLHGSHALPAPAALRRHLPPAARRRHRTGRRPSALSRAAAAAANPTVHAHRPLVRWRHGRPAQSVEVPGGVLFHQLSLRIWRGSLMACVLGWALWIRRGVAQAGANTQRQKRTLLAAGFGEARRCCIVWCRAGTRSRRRSCRCRAAGGSGLAESVLPGGADGPALPGLASVWGR
jgi:hypothetical protein